MPTKNQCQKIADILLANKMSYQYDIVVKCPAIWKQLLKLYPEAPVRVA